MKKFLSILIAVALFATAFTTVFAVETSDNSSTDTSAQDVVVPNPLQEKYPKVNFNLTKLGDLGEYTLYYNKSHYCTNLYYIVTMGNYDFECFAQQSPYDLGLYVVGNDAYTLKEAYDQGLVNIDSVVALIQSQDINYNFNVSKTQDVVVSNPLQAKYPKVNFNLTKLGDLGEYTLYYNKSQLYTNLYYIVTMGNYDFECFAQQYPYDLGLYVVGNDAYTLKEAYDQGLVNIDSVVDLIQSQNINYNFNVSKTEATSTAPVTTKPAVKTPKLSAAKANLKSGQSKTLKVTNGKVKSWASSNKNIVSVNKGKITALNKGEATVTATLTTGKKLTCKVTVTTAPKLIKNSVKVKKGSVVIVKISGKAAFIKNKYTNTKVAKITSKANASTLKIKGLKKGTTTLKIKVNGVKTLKLKVTVK